MLVRGVFCHQYVLKFKNVWNWSERGGQHFSSKSEIQKSLKYPIGGGGGQAYWGKSPQFSRFLIMTPPLTYLTYLQSTYFTIFNNFERSWGFKRSICNHLSQKSWGNKRHRKVFNSVRLSKHKVTSIWYQRFCIR